MRNNIGHIFVDDGYPEADEYDTNYVSYNLAEPGSYTRAVDTANGMLKASRTSQPRVFRSIPIESRHEWRRPRSYRLNRTQMEFRRIRNKLVRLIKN